MLAWLLSPLRVQLTGPGCRNGAFIPRPDQDRIVNGNEHHLRRSVNHPDPGNILTGFPTQTSKVWSSMTESCLKPGKHKHPRAPSVSVDPGSAESGVPACPCAPAPTPSGAIYGRLRGVDFAWLSLALSLSDDGSAIPQSVGCPGS